MDDNKVIDTADNQTEVSEPLTMTEAEQISGGNLPGPMADIICKKKGHDLHEIRALFWGDQIYREFRCDRCLKHIYLKNGQEISKKQFEKECDEIDNLFNN